MKIEAQTGTAFVLRSGQTLTVWSPAGGQVADLFCFSQSRPRDALSSGRSIDYNETVYLTTGHTLFSNEGLPLLRITHDECGRHDFLVTPCSQQMFEMISGRRDRHPSCHENLCRALALFDRPPDLITTTFNIFMNYEIDREGRIHLLAPRNAPGAKIRFLAAEDLVVGLTACADPATNGGRCVPVEFEIN